MLLQKRNANRGKYGSINYYDPEIRQNRRVRQMSREWIWQKATEMVDETDPATQEAGKMLVAALSNDSYRGPLNPNGQRLTSDLIDARGYRVANRRGQWREIWTHDPQNSGLQDNRAIWNE
ncbi:hypothetical protein [Thermoactinomyces mirandus]|uniref:Uncharacterized protein n=1 Tax=Thermoactinomyces mirandus TaxID=2756294 RepID=A0A7W1XQX1_9BACL|nr:hypothetical protein [Thermoactinomyces mirandus]MBA4601546.1 hypothetical protein [Thermoactinomyces mirandus]